MRNLKPKPKIVSQSHTQVAETNFFDDHDGNGNGITLTLYATKRIEPGERILISTLNNSNTSASGERERDERAPHAVGEQ